MTDETTTAQPEETAEPEAPAITAVYPGQSLMGADRPDLHHPTEREAKAAEEAAAPQPKATKRGSK